ncbi:hypothetical protein [Vibrio phage BX-1]|nr:hypothetical protein [Vibrio phage BX-1]
MQCPCGGTAKSEYKGDRKTGMTVTITCPCGRHQTQTIPGTKPKGLRAKLKRNK